MTADDILPPHPTDELDDDDLLRQLEQLYRTRLDTLRGGSDAALTNSDARIGELEAAYLRRRPQREVSARRLRPDETSLSGGAPSGGGEQTAKHGPGQDDYLRQEVRQTGHVEEFHQVEPGATGEAGDRGDIELRSRIAATLGRRAFPADRAGLLAAADDAVADDDVLRALRRLPDGEVFENVQAVGLALGLELEQPQAPR